MAQNITIAGASYNAVPAIEVPKQGTGTAIFADPSGTTAVASDVATGKYFLNISGVLTLGTASGGGGQYAWLGSGAEKVGTVINKTINLKNDTTYDSWTASTTAGVIKAASTTADYTATVSLTDYDYLFVTRAFCQPVYFPGTEMKNVIYRRSQYYIYNCFGMPNSLSDLQNESMSAGNQFSSAAIYHEVYYNSFGSLAAGLYSEGPIYTSASPTVTYSSGSITYKIPAISAKCNNTRFATGKKTAVDSENTNLIYTVDLYRVPRGNGLASKWVQAMMDDLTAT